MHIGLLIEKIADVKAETQPVIVNWSPNSWDRLTQNSVDYTVTRENFEALMAKSPRVFNRSTGNTTFERCKDNYLGKLDGRLRHWKIGLADCRKRNAGWRQTMQMVAGEWVPFVAPVTVVA
jgi:hypothetical protein